MTSSSVIPEESTSSILKELLQPIGPLRSLGFLLIKVLPLRPSLFLVVEWSKLMSLFSSLQMEDTTKERLGCAVINLTFLAPDLHLWHAG